jgi:phosphoenolpyruvate synthase/pyruvate phosphate dikinase
MPGNAEPQLEHDERVDRDSEMVAVDYGESEPGVLELCRMAIAAIEAELAR